MSDARKAQGRFLVLLALDDGPKHGYEIAVRRRGGLPRRDLRGHLRALKKVVAPDASFGTEPITPIHCATRPFCRLGRPGRARE